VITDIDIDLPVRTVYNQWTQFEEFPHFMHNVETVEQIDDRHLHWRVRIAGVEREWDAEIIEQVPDERIAWAAIDGTTNAGVVTFHPLDENRTRVVMQLEFEPEGAVEMVAEATGIVRSRVSHDLEEFKEFIESRHVETGGWRGEIDPLDPDDPVLPETQVGPHPQGGTTPADTAFNADTGTDTGPGAPG
jgi:uncharacterized membrane protein